MPERDTALLSRKLGVLEAMPPSREQGAKRDFERSWRTP
jgi:hypothetical protein